MRCFLYPSNGKFVNLHIPNGQRLNLSYWAQAQDQARRNPERLLLSSSGNKTAAEEGKTVALSSPKRAESSPSSFSSSSSSSSSSSAAAEAKKRPPSRSACRQRYRNLLIMKEMLGVIQRAIQRRAVHTTVEEAPRLTKLTLQKPKSVEVEFADGTKFNLSAEFLRTHSPAVDGKLRSIGGEKVIFGRRHVGIMSAEPVGNYGVRILFDDLHKTGIYTWDYFYHLGRNKFTLMKDYIRTLKKHGLSRDPSRRKG